MRWWNLSAHRAVGRLTHYSWQSLSPGGNVPVAPVMQQGSHILHTALLRLCWESIMFTTGSPPFSPMGACYRYNPRYAQSISVPKVWKYRHRRSVTPEEGKLGSITLHLFWGGEMFWIEMIRIGNSSLLIFMCLWINFPVRNLKCCWSQLLKMLSEH